MAEPRFATAGAVAVAPPAAGNRLAGPGTGRVTAQPGDARRERIASRRAADHPVPTGREEAWRFTPLRRLAPLLAGAPADRPLSVTTELAGGRVDRDDPRVGAVALPTDRAAAVALERTEAPLLLTVAPGERVRGTLRLRGEGGLAYDHVVVEVGAGAELALVVDHTGSGTVGTGLELALGDGAAVSLVSLQDWQPDAVHVATQAARLGRDARLRAVAVSLGGSLVRLSPSVVFAGPGGQADLYGVYLAGADQHLEHRVFIDHAQAGCRSRVTYKGAVAGSGAHSVWIGDVLIRAGAVGTDTYELNRNLLLTDGARADSVPNLEIETGEVARAGHASATGRFDDEQLFYLCARGIPPALARRLVVRGFFAEVLGQLGDEDLRHRLTERIDGKLDRDAA